MSKTIRKPANLECPACESKNILTNKDGIRHCRRCGFGWKAQNETKKSD
jgi:ribosomal protein L37AE/L43A